MVRRLGAGGMADVYEVEHATTRRRLALKLLRPEVSGSRVNVERFYREASVCAGIDSDHIVQIIDCDVDKATSIPFLVMELLQGKDLATWVHEGFDAGAPPPTALVLTVLKQVASALDKVHARGIVHRDLKPANLFLTFPSDGPPRLKILDFGVARLVTDTELSSPGKVGTPLYMSPEQLRAGEAGPAADIWALALITYELFVGAPYWEGNTAATLFARIPDREAHPQPSTLAARHNVTLPRAFDLWLLRCIDPDPARRPPTAGAAVGDLLRIFDPKATQPPRRRRLPPSARRSLPPSASQAAPCPRAAASRPRPAGRASRAAVPPQIPMPGAAKGSTPTRSKTSRPPPTSAASARARSSRAFATCTARPPRAWSP
ncbi:MAG: protein kinase [Polyangiales bacterium]